MTEEVTRRTAGKKQVPLHPEASRLVALMERLQRKPYYELESVEEARKMSLQSSLNLAGKYDFTGITEDIRIPSAAVKEGIRARVYRPEGLPSNPAIFVYYHGGGQTLGSIESHDVCCKSLADYCKTIMMSVEYRLAPEHKLPAQFEDAECAATWALQNKTTLGGTDLSSVGVGGDSAGGHISATVCHNVKGLAFQILVYPHVDIRNQFPAYDEYEEVPVLDRKVIEWFVNHFKPDEPDAFTNSRYSPYQQPRFDHLPPALFIVAECDPLRDDSYEYAKKLSAAGVYNELVLFKGALHAFFHVPGFYKECCHKAYTAVAKFIKEYVYGARKPTEKL